MYTSTNNQQKSQTRQQQQPKNKTHPFIQTVTRCTSPPSKTPQFPSWLFLPSHRDLFYQFPAPSLPYVRQKQNKGESK